MVSGGAGTGCNGVGYRYCAHTQSGTHQCIVQEGGGAYARFVVVGSHSAHGRSNCTQMQRGYVAYA